MFSQTVAENLGRYKYENQAMLFALWTSAALWRTLNSVCNTSYKNVKRDSFSAKSLVHALFVFL